MTIIYQKIYKVVYNTHYTMELTKKEEILKWLKQFDKLSTSRIMGLIGLNQNYTIKYLEELEKEKMIVKEKETNATYWRQKK